MVRIIVLIILLSIMWMMLTGIITLESFILGVLLSAAIVIALLPRRPRRWKVSFGAVGSLLWYVLVLLRQIFSSDFAVALRILSPKPVNNAGVVEIPVGSTSDSHAALSAHAITASPGSFAVGFKTAGKQKVMLIHVIDEALVQEVNEQQAQRQKLYERITRE